MQTQLDFEATHATYKAQLGIERAAREAGEAWAAEALDFIHTYVLQHPTVFVDDLWDAGLSKPTSPRALGAIIQSAVRRGWIREIKHNGMVCALPSVNSNMQLKRVWESICYDEFNF